MKKIYQKTKSCKNKKRKNNDFINCIVCDRRKSKFIKKQEASGLLSSLGLKTPSSQIYLINPILFYGYKVNEIINTFLLPEDNFMPDMYLSQISFTYSACEVLLKTKNEYKNLKKPEIQNVFTTTN